MSEIDDLYVILRAQYAPMVEGFQAVQGEGEKMATAVVAAANEITAQVERMAQAVRTELGIFDEATNKAAYDMDRLAKQTAAASMEMEAATARAAKANEKLATAGLASQFKAVRGAVTGAAVALDVVAAGSVKAAADFQSSTQKIVSSGGEIQSNLSQVRSGLLAMTGDVGESADALSAAFYKASSGGFAFANGGLTVVRAAAEGAKTEQADLAVVTDALTSTMRDYHAPASQAANITSQLVAATSQGKMTFQELAGSLHSVLPIASQAHIALSDILGAEAAMTVHGMSADQATQNLADAIRHLEAPTGTMTKELGQLGISSGDLSGMLSTKGLTGTMQYLSETILSKMGPSGKVLLSAFNQSKDAAADANKMIAAMPATLQKLAGGFKDGSISLGDWRKDLKALPPEQANLLTQWAALQNRASGFSDILKSGGPAAQSYVAALKAATGDATGLNVALMLTGENTNQVNDSVKTIAGSTAEAGGHVKGWAQIQQTFNQRLSEAKAGLGAMGVEMGNVLLPALTKLVGWLGTAAGWLAKHPALAKALAVAVGILAAAFTALSIAMWAVALNPVGLIVAGIVIAVGLLVVAIYELVTHWKTIWGFIWGLMKDIGHWFAHDFAGFFIQVWQHIWNDFLQPVGHWFESVFNDVKHFLFGVGHWFSHDFVDFFVGMWHGIVKVWDGITAFFRKWWPLLLVIFAPPIALLLAIWNHFHTQIVGAAKTAWNWITGFLKGAWGDIKDAGVAIWHGIYDGIVNPIEKLVHWLHDQWEIVKLGATIVWNSIKDKAVAVWHDIYDAIIRPVEDAWHAITAKFDQIKQTISSKFDEAWHAVEHVGDKFVDVGEGIVRGIMHGISNGWHWLTNQVGNLANDALKSAKNFLGISSPSKVMADQVGRWIPHGIAVGIQDAAGVAHDAMGRLTAGLLGQPTGVASSIGLRIAPAAVTSATVAAMSAAGAVGGGGMQQVVINIDGKKVFDAMVPYAQQRGIRNAGNTFMTRPA